MSGRGLILFVILASGCGSAAAPGPDAGGGGAADGAADGADATIDGPGIDAPGDSSLTGAPPSFRVVPRLKNPEEGETETFASEECRCPDGYACTGSQTVSTGVVTRNGLGGYHDPAIGGESVPSGRGTATYKVCEPMDRQKPALVLDYRDDQPLVPITLRFRRAGRDWPQSATAGSAGDITITPPGLKAPLVQPIPTDAGGTLKLMLRRGRHGVSLQMGRGPTFDPFTYPISTLEGELTVDGPGEAVIDVPATPFTFDVRAGGAPFPVPHTGESVAVRIEGRYGLPGLSSNLFVWKRTAGQALEKRTVWLEPGKYTVYVITEGALDNPSLPGGYLIATRFLEVGAAPLEQTFDLNIVKLEGDITVDGKDLPAAARAEVDLLAKDAVARGVLGAARPAHYGVLAFAGEYRVLLATESGSESAGVPAGALRAFTRLVDRNLVAPIAATTLAWSGEVTRNGAVLPDAPAERGALVLDGVLNHQLSLGKSGPGAFSGLVYQGGPSAVKVLGTGQAGLPALPVTVAADYTPTSTPARFDVALAPVTVGLRIDGKDPPASTTTRGLFSFTRADDPALSVRVPASLAGPLLASVALPAGAWKARFQSAGAADLPIGDVSLPDLMVPAEGLTRDLELTSVSLTIEVRRNGSLLPDATGSKDRGAIQVGSTRLRLPRTGPAGFNLRVLPGVTSIAVICDDACGAGLPPFVVVAPRLKVGP